MKATLSLWSRLLALPAILGSIVAIHYTVWGFQREPIDPAEAAWHIVASQPDRGKTLIQQYGCTACHTVPGVPGATGKVGPALSSMRELVYIAGVLPNSPQNLVYWIQHPRQVDPRTAMPDLGVTIQDSRDIAAYLYQVP